MSQIVCRIAKLKTHSEVSAAGNHNDRKRVVINADPTAGVVEIVKANDVVQAVQNKIGKQTVRKNAVLAVEMVISASPEYFRPTNVGKAGYYEPEKLEAFRQAVEPWIKQQCGNNAVQVTLHLDEATPHYHIIEVPLDEKGKLNCRGKYGGVENLRNLQTSIGNAVKHLDIERGTMHSEAEHENIKSYYASVNADLPQLPDKPKAPAKLPEPTYSEVIPLMKAAKERKEAEAEYEQKRQEFNAKNKQYNAKLQENIKLLTAQAEQAKREERRRKEAEATAKRLEAAYNEAKAKADQLRQISLESVLKRLYNADLDKLSKQGHKHREYIFGSNKIVVQDDGKWFDNQAGKGNKGAINLVMHLENCDYKKAVRILAEYFPSDDVTAEYAARTVESAGKTVKNIVNDTPAPLPAASPASWEKVKQYLSYRKLDDKLVDDLHKQGKIYADIAENVVFLREKGGCFIRGTQGVKWFRTVGNAEKGGFIMQGNDVVILVESPIDAIACKQLNPENTVIAIGGNLIGASKIASVLPENCKKVMLGFDNDPVGETMCRNMKPGLELAGMKPERLQPGGFKDWNEYLMKKDTHIDKVTGKVMSNSEQLQKLFKEKHGIDIFGGGR